MINAGDFRHRIIIVRRTQNTDGQGFKTPTETEVVKAWAKINTTKGYTLVSQGSNFEDATTRFLIRTPSETILRTDIVLFRGKEWRIRYLNNIDQSNELTELQCEEVEK